MARRLRCPYCGAEFEAPEGFSHVVCPYCGTVIVVETGERAEAWIYPARLEEHDAFQAALSRASQLPGAPEDIAEAAQYRRGELHYIPLHLCRAWARVEGCEGAEAAAEAAEAAASAPWLPGWYRFPAVGRAAFNPSEARRGVFHQVEKPPGHACRGLEERLAAEAAAEAGFMGCSGPVRSGSEYLGVAHYPFWVLRYTHPAGDGEYTAVVDAVDANVVYLEYPIPGARRARLLALAATAAAAGAAGAGLVAALAHDWMAAAGWVSSLAAAAPFLGKAVARTGRYTPRKPRAAEAVIREA